MFSRKQEIGYNKGFYMMTKEEKDEWLDKIDDISSTISELQSELEDFREIVDENIETSPNLAVWKHTVLDSIPTDCSLKFRKDVEELLEKFNKTY